MTILSLLVQLFSGAMLLLFAVRFLRIGIERLWSTHLRSSLHEGSSIVRSLSKGAILGFAMQGGTVVMLMVAGLAGNGAISISSAAIVALGADMGSALAVGFLQLPVAGLGPLLILIGATLYLRAPMSRLRNIGRVVLGLGLIFLSLSIIRTTVEPIGAAQSSAAVAEYLTRDTIASALAGMVLTLVMHSSVAALLTAVAFSGHVDLGPAAALGFMLGCNVGSALLPIWLLKRENNHTKIVALAVAAVRVTAGIALIATLAIARGSIDAAVEITAGDTMLAGHLVFNFLLLLLAPLCRITARFLEARLVGKPDRALQPIPANVLSDAGLFAPSLKRMMSAMLDVASNMLEEVTSSNPDKEKMAGLEQRMNTGLASIRDIYAKLAATDDAVLVNLQQIVDFAIRIERCGDVLAGKYLALRLEQAHGYYAFTRDGTEEIAEIAGAVRQSIILAHEAAWTGDVSAAERLVRHKRHVSDLEERSRHKHLARLRGGNLISLSSSNQHLEVIAALKEINSKFATIGYAVLEQHGGLRKTRLKSSISASAP